MGERSFMVPKLVVARNLDNRDGHLRQSQARHGPRGVPVFG